MDAVEKSQRKKNLVGSRKHCIFSKNNAEKNETNREGK